MAETFCKLFETEYGQLLIKIDRNSEANPEVRFSCQPPGLGVTDVAVSYEDDDEGWDKAEAYFDSFDKSKAIELYMKVEKMCEVGNG